MLAVHWKQIDKAVACFSDQVTLQITRIHAERKNTETRRLAGPIPSLQVPSFQRS